ncbi:MAG: phosphatase PAP2 family protein [Muribaculaceae bacterium]|nr:phosphatase PAP2 family protein [Muribaculaceae bacterium]
MENTPLIRIARFFSGLFSPLLMPTYVVAVALWATYLNVTTLGTRLMVLAAVFAFSCMLPIIVIFFLRAIKYIESTNLDNRRDRVIPYFITTLTYIGLSIYLNRIHAPAWLILFFAGTSAAGFINLLITLKWKISGHATAMGGLVAMAIFASARNLAMHPQWWWIIVAVMIAGVVASSRLLLRCHTPAQIAAGFLTGLLCIGIPVFVWG